jgi:hypothetical protein
VTGHCKIHVSYSETHEQVIDADHADRELLSVSLDRKPAKTVGVTMRRPDPDPPGGGGDCHHGLFVITESIRASGADLRASTSDEISIGHEADQPITVDIVALMPASSMGAAASRIVRSGPIPTPGGAENQYGAHECSFSCSVIVVFEVLVARIGAGIKPSLVPVVAPPPD